jgi:hypothetical protein
MGHNSDGELTVEEREALLHTHLDTVRIDDAARAAHMAAGRALAKRRNNNRNTAKNETNLLLEQLDRILKDEARDDQGLLQEELDNERWARQARGLPVGAQMDLLSEAPADSSKRWADHGYRAGLRGADCVPPDGCAPDNHQVWIKRWGDGQATIAASLRTVSSLKPPADDEGGGQADDEPDNSDDPEIPAFLQRLAGGGESPPDPEPEFAEVE